jgi:MFS family permease
MYPIVWRLNLFRLWSSSDSTFTIGRNVVFLGLTSLFTDISSEMVVSILPIYLITFLRLTPVQFGLVDGLYNGVAAVVQLISGFMTDRSQRYKEMAGLGYLASAVCRIGLLMTTAWTGIAAVLTLDRLGKGIRTAPRDALISLSTPREALGTAFGVHRALDAAGAMLGPIIAFVVLAWIPGGFDVVFVASLSAAVIGLAFLGFFVDNRTPQSADGSRGLALRDLLGLLVIPQYRHLIVCAIALSLVTVSDAFVYLALQRRTNLATGAFPLLYVMTALGYLALAVPAGRLADRVGRFRVFVGGYALLLVADLILLTGTGGWALVAGVLLLMGAHYAATEGVLMALGSVILPESARASGLAMLTTAIATARLGSSLLFGLVWSAWGLQAAILTFLIGLAAAIVLAVLAHPGDRHDSK